MPILGSREVTREPDQLRRKGLARQERDEIRQIFEEEQIKELSEADKQALSEISYFTGNPLPGDILLFCIPVVAPYSAIQNYKFKAKLTPGTVKRGKAAQTVVQMFVRGPTTSQREKDLILTIPDQELTTTMPGNVKISAPQSLLTQITKKKKTK